MKNTIELVKEQFGSVQKLADLLDISRQTIYQWPDGIINPRTKAINDRIELAWLKMKNPAIFDSER